MKPTLCGIFALTIFVSASLAKDKPPAAPERPWAPPRLGEYERELARRTAQGKSEADAGRSPPRLRAARSHRPRAAQPSGDPHRVAARAAGGGGRRAEREPVLSLARRLGGRRLRARLHPVSHSQDRWRKDRAGSHDRGGPAAAGAPCAGRQSLGRDQRARQAQSRSLRRLHRWRRLARHRCGLLARGAQREVAAVRFRRAQGGRRRGERAAHDGQCRLQCDAPESRLRSHAPVLRAEQCAAKGDRRQGGVSCGANGRAVGERAPQERPRHPAGAPAGAAANGPDGLRAGGGHRRRKRRGNRPHRVARHPADDAPQDRRPRRTSRCRRRRIAPSMR